MADAKLKNITIFKFIIVAVVWLGSCTLSTFVHAQDDSDSGKSEASSEEDDEPVVPWDYSPYNVLIWVVSDDPMVQAASLDRSIRTILNHRFSAIWRVTIQDAPAAVRVATKRGIQNVDYDSLVSSDPVVALKSNHKESIRIRIPKNIADYVGEVQASPSLLKQVKERAEENGQKDLDGAMAKFKSFADGEFVDVRNIWAEEKTEAVIVPRGLAASLAEPKAKLISLPISGMISETVEQYDKIYLVHIDQSDLPGHVDVVEMETLMRFFGNRVRVPFVGRGEVPAAVSRAVTKAFSPVVRIEEAGIKTATGMVRAHGLIVDSDSPGLIGVNDVLMPMVRKNDRNGRPLIIGPMDWAFLVVEELDKALCKMGFYAGRAGGLQGRKNKRTFRIALKVDPLGDTTTVRLHAKGDSDEPLIGYELYEKELKSKKMTFVGRTDWDGRFSVSTKPDHDLRLLYVKNGGAVLARLPLVPGLTQMEIADLVGDDVRLRAEAYIRGVENAIVDLVAVRKLFAARVRLRLQKGEMERARELMEVLRQQPSNEQLANEMGKMNTMFINIDGLNMAQRAKIDNMFKNTRSMLSKMITRREIADLEDDLVKAEKNGGRLVIEKSDEDEIDPNANEVSPPPENDK